MIFFGHLGLTTGAVKIGEKIGKYTDIDYRFVLIGAILPDLIDKPVGAVLFRSTFHNSRIFGHTVLFSTIIILLGIYQFKRNKNNSILFLGIGSAIHLILDSMWIYPHTLFWPYFGLRFPTRPEGQWVRSDLVRLVSDPKYYLSEFTGFIIIAHYFIRLIKNKNLKVFLKDGRL